jgi:hypothetical protein
MTETKNSTEATTTRAFDASLLGASPDAAVAAAEKAGERAEALVEAWVKAGNAGAVNEVAERGSGKARKAARRGLNVLKARGVTIPDRARIANLGGGKEPTLEEAWLVAPDTQGTCVLAIAARTLTSRARAVIAFLNPSVGIYRIQNTELAQSQLKQSLADLVPAGAYKPVPVPVAWARKRIADARAFQKDKKLAEPLGLASAEALLTPVPSQPIAHPLDAAGLELDDEAVKERSEKTAFLHNLPEFGGWLPSREAVNELLAKVGETLTPGKEAEATVVQERLAEEVRAATDRYFTPERRGDLVSLMKDSALSVLANHGEDRARDVVATMRAVERRGLITDPPHEVPFLRAFFDKAMAVLAAQNGGQLRIPVAPKRDDAG